MTKRYKFQFVDALAGSGKTYQALSWSVKQAHYDKQKTVIVFKSKLLMEQAHKDANAFKLHQRAAIRITAINSDQYKVSDDGNTHNSVVAAILSHLKASEQDVGEVLLITEAAFLQMPFWPNRWNWNCILDEIPNVAPAHTLNIPENFKMLTDHLTLEPKMALHSLAKISPGGKSAIKSYADNKMKDEISALFTPLAKELISADYDVFTLASSFDRVIRGDSLNAYHQLQFFSLLKPSIFGTGDPINAEYDETLDEFATVTIMGACLKDSLMYYIWLENGVVFERHDEICKGLRYHNHTCGKRLTIKYLFEGSWSKNCRDRTQKIGTETLSNLDIQLAAITEEFDKTGFVYLVNKDKENEVKTELAELKGIQLPNSPYGLNHYQHFNQAVVLSALNTTPAHYKFLSHLGVDAEAVRESLYHQACYQAIMRTSLRNKASTDPVKIIVSDRSAAISLQKLFPESSVRGVINGIYEQPQKQMGRPQKEIKKSKADIQRQTRSNQKRIRQLIEATLVGKKPSQQEIQELEEQCRADNRDLMQLKVLYNSRFSCISDNKFTLSVSVFRSIHNSTGAGKAVLECQDYDQFMDELCICSKSTVASKQENVLLCTTAFDTSLSQATNRGLDNITHIWGVWLDIDGGVMPIDELPKLFPHLRMAVFNSWSAGNYRVFIPTTDYMSIGAYDTIMKKIVQSVEQTAPSWEILDAQTNGRNPKYYVSGKKAEQQRKNGKKPNPIHGIDFSKLTPSSLFYLPSKCGDDPSKSFFIDHNSNGRMPLNTDDWLKYETLEAQELDDNYQRLNIQSDAVPQMWNGNSTHKSCSLQTVSNGINQTIIDNAIAEYRSIRDGNNRHNGFFAAIHKIHYFANVPINQLHQYMSQCDYDGHQRKQYKSVLKNLANGKYAPKQNT